VLVRHEQAAVHAADGYARATGDVGVALVTSGPGVTNAVTGIATAYMDSIPMVIITGQVPTPAIGLDAFQECDTVGITRPVVKHNFLVKDVRDLALTLKKAFHIARTGRPGPVVVDIPKDVSLKTAPFHYPETVEMRSYNPVKKGHGGQIRKAVHLLLQAKRPYIYTGGGVILGNASAELRQLVDLLGFPLHQHADGPGRHRLHRPALPGHAGHARHLRSQHDDAELRRPAGRGRALRRPRDRQPQALCLGRTQDHSRGHRPLVDFQARAVDIPIVGDVKEVLVELIAQIKEAQARPDAGASMPGGARSTSGASASA
jgi:acetolactate synthase-1/2/3 large subunit